MHTYISGLRVLLCFALRILLSLDESVLPLNRNLFCKSDTPFFYGFQAAWSFPDIPGHSLAGVCPYRMSILHAQGQHTQSCPVYSSWLAGWLVWLQKGAPSLQANVPIQQEGDGTLQQLSPFSVVSILSFTSHHSRK